MYLIAPDGHVLFDVAHESVVIIVVGVETLCADASASALDNVVGDDEAVDDGGRWEGP